MTRNHDWPDCRPEITLDGGDPPPPDAVAMAWSLVPDADRRLFHEYCCHNQTGPDHLAAMARVTDTVRTALEPYTRADRYA